MDEPGLAVEVRSENTVSCPRPASEINRRLTRLPRMGVRVMMVRVMAALAGTALLAAAILSDKQHIVR